MKVLVEGQQRAKITQFYEEEYFFADAQYLVTPELDEREHEVVVRIAINQFEGFIKGNKKIPPEVLSSLNGIDEAARLKDTIAAHMPLKLVVLRKVLEQLDVSERLEFLMGQMESEIVLLRVEQRIRTRVKSRWKSHSASTI